MFCSNLNHTERNWNQLPHKFLCISGSKSWYSTSAFLAKFSNLSILNMTNHYLPKFSFKSEFSFLFLKIFGVTNSTISCLVGNSFEKIPFTALVELFGNNIKDISCHWFPKHNELQVLLPAVCSEEMSVSFFDKFDNTEFAGQCYF